MEEKATLKKLHKIIEKEKKKAKKIRHRKRLVKHHRVTSFPIMLFFPSPCTERRLARHPRNRRGRREGNLGRSTLVIHQMRPLLPPLATTQTAVGPCLLNLPREGESTGHLVTDLAQGPDLKVHLTEGEEQEQLPHQTVAH